MIASRIDSRFEKVKDGRSSVFVIGDAGAGKSTLINFLAGIGLVLRKKEYEAKILIDTLEDAEIGIGHSVFQKLKFQPFKKTTMTISLLIQLVLMIQKEPQLTSSMESS